MSVPNTGKLEAVVNGIPCQFDGTRWTSDDAHLAETLNVALELCPTQHFDIRSLAERVFKTAGLDGRYQITTVNGDTWADQMPEDALD